MATSFWLLEMEADTAKLGDAMTKLVFKVIGKYIHPRRYRQIVETESLNHLISKEQRILSSRDTSAYQNYKVPRDKKWYGRSTEVWTFKIKLLVISWNCRKDGHATNIPPGHSTVSSLDIEIYGRRRRLPRGRHKETRVPGRWSLILRDADFKIEGRMILWTSLFRVENCEMI